MHIDIETSLKGITLKTAGKKHVLLPYTIWMLMEHIPDHAVGHYRIFRKP